MSYLNVKACRVILYIVNMHDKRNISLTTKAYCEINFSSTWRIETMAGKKTTIKTIAQKAGVTPASVSLALNDRPGLSPQTRQKIIRIAKELNYQPDLVARSMIKKKSQTIGLLVNNVSDPFFARMVDIVETVADNNGYSVIVCNVHNNSDLEKRHIDILDGKRVDGMVIAAVNCDSPHIKNLVEKDYPLVFVHRRVYDREVSKRVHHIILDNHNAGYDAVTHLFRLGHDRIAVLAGTLKSSANVERTEGVKKALQEHGIFNSSCIVECNNSKEEAYVATEKLIRNKKPPTAFFALDDDMAVSSREALLKNGLSIPETAALLGFDDIEVSSLTGIELSTVREKESCMARLGAELLIENLKLGAVNQHNAPVQIVLESELVIRKTCGYHKTGYVR